MSHLSLLVSVTDSVSSSKAVDLTYGAVYCYSCGDYVYDKEFEAIAKEEKTKAAKFVGKSNPTTSVERVSSHDHGFGVR